MTPSLSVFDTTMIVVSLVIGIGIFRTPAIVASGTGSAPIFFLAWAVGGGISALGALTFAEIGSLLAEPGGYYKAVAESYHSALAFMLNWAGVLMQGAGAAGVSFIGAEYLNPLVLPAGYEGRRAVQITACLLMLLLLAVNYLGIRAGASAQNVLTLLKIAMILVLAVAALTSGGATTTATVARATPGWSGFLGALVAVFYTYGGYHNTINVGGDVRDVRRKLPIAILAGVGIVIALYLLVNAGYEHTLGVAGIARSKLVAADVARVCFGASGHAIISAAIFLSATGFVNATILHVPRSYYAMAQDRLLPRAFLRVNPRTQVQGFALLFFGATMIAPAVFLGSFEKLLNYVMFTDALSLAVVASTIFVLRKRAGANGSVDCYRAPGYPVGPGVFVLTLAGVAGYVAWTETSLALIGTAIFLTGYPLFVLMRRSQGGS